MAAIRHGRVQLPADVAQMVRPRRAVRSRCPWCAGSDWEPFDSIEAQERLCRAHQAEFEGCSIDALDRADAAAAADMSALGYFDR